MSQGSGTSWNPGRAPIAPMVAESYSNPPTTPMISDAVIPFHTVSPSPESRASATRIEPTAESSATSEAINAFREPEPGIALTQSRTAFAFGAAEWDVLGIMSILENITRLMEMTGADTFTTYQRVHKTLTEVFATPEDPALESLREAIRERGRFLRTDGFRQAFLASLQLIGRFWPWLAASETSITFNVQQRWMMCKKLELYVIQLKQKYKNADEMSHQYCAGEGLGRLFFEAASYEYDGSNHPRASDFLNEAFSVCENAERAEQRQMSVPARTHKFSPLRTQIYGLTGRIASETGNLSEAIQHFHKQASLLLEKDPGQQTRSLTEAYIDYAFAKMATGRYGEAENYLDKRIRITFPLQASLEPHEAKTLYALGWLAYLRGNLDEAWVCFNGVLAKREQVLGLEDWEGTFTGDLLYAMGNISLSRGRATDSWSNYSLAIHQLQRTVGLKHASTAKVSYKLAGHYMAVEDYESATMLLNQALDFYAAAETNDRYRAHRARTHFRIGGLLGLKGEIEAAGRAETTAWMERRKVIGRDDGLGVRELREDDYDALVPIWAR